MRLVSLCLVLLLVVVVVSKKEDCPSYGCALLPRDVIFDSEARSALKEIGGAVSSKTPKEKKKKAAALRELQSSGNDDRVTMTLIGYKGGELSDQINQDRAFVLDPFMKDETAGATAPLLMGVLDGHGRLGEVVSEYARDEIPKRLAEKLADLPSIDDGSVSSQIEAALKETFVEVDESVPTDGVGGCTSTVTLRWGNKVYVANAGDSVTMVAVHIAMPSLVDEDDEPQPADILFVTREDKPHLPDERERIESMGGTVSIPRSYREDSSRVMHTDPKTGMQTGLAMSRSIGDWMMVGVIAEPLVETLDLEEIVNEIVEERSDCSDGTCVSLSKDNVHIFAVAASDGLMDYIDPPRLVNAFAAAFYEQDKSGPSHPFLTAETLIHEAAKQWHADMGGQYRDDIVVAAAKLYP